jgi:hypothetical protein
MWKKSSVIQWFRKSRYAKKKIGITNFSVFLYRGNIRKIRTATGRQIPQVIDE